MAEPTTDSASIANRDRRQNIRQQRKDFEDNQQAKDRRRDLMYIIGGGVVILAIIAGLVFFLYQRSTMQMGEVVEDEGRTHVNQGTPITYQHNPPASGNHYPSPGPWQVFDVAEVEGFWVHNLEHGGVVLLFQCDGDACKATADKIRGIASALPKSRWDEIKFVATPYNKTDSSMTTPFMMVSWGRQLPMETLDAETIRTFYKLYVDKGPEDAP